MIPREKIVDLKKQIDNNIDKNDVKKPHTIYYFKSLNLRSLEKLCFKENDNTFKEEILEEIKKCNKHSKSSETNICYPI